MAHNRMYLRCRGCGEEMMLGKCFISGWYFSIPEQKKGEQLQEFLEKHSHCCDPPEYDPYEGMSDEERIAVSIFHSVTYIVLLFIALAQCAIITGCTTTRYIPVPEVHEHWHHTTDTVTQTDSVTDRQTTIIREVDSATMARYGIQMKDMQRAWLIETDRLQRELSALRATRTDTVHERDSIPYPVEVVREVPRERSTVEWVLLIVGITAIALMFFGITIKI